MNQETSIDFKYSDLLDFHDYLEEGYGEKNVTYRSFSDVWEIREGMYRHTLNYYSYRETKIMTELEKTPKVLFLIKFGIILILFLPHLYYEYWFLNDWLGDSAFFYMMFFLV